MTETTTPPPDRPAPKSTGPTLQVIIAQDGDGWAAQAIEVDYATGGDSVKDAMERFTVGLKRTADAQMMQKANLSNLKTPAKPEEWVPLLTNGYRLTNIVNIVRRAVNLRRHGLVYDAIAFIITASVKD